MKFKLLTIFLFSAPILISCSFEPKEQACAGSPITLKKGQLLYDSISSSWSDCTTEYSNTHGKMYVKFKDGSAFYAVFEHTNGYAYRGQVASYKVEDGKIGTGPHGQGTATYPDGTQYVGQFKNGKWHGQGTYTFPDGTQYVGEFKEGKLDGQGTHTFPDGSQYVGQFKNGKWHGQGTATYHNGHRYVGEFKEGKLDGQGTYTFPDGEQYVGQYKNGQRHGQGTYTIPDGEKYVGEWKNDKPHGQGTATYPDGAKYVGAWKNGKRHGQGIHTYSDGRILVGEFRNDKSYKGYEINKDNLLLSCQYLYTKTQTDIKIDPHKTYLYFDNYEYAKTKGYGIVNIYQLFDGQSNLYKFNDIEYAITETKIMWSDYMFLYLNTFIINRDSLEFVWSYVSISGSITRFYSCDVAKEKEIIKFHLKKDQAKKREQDKKDDIQNRNKI